MSVRRLETAGAVAVVVAGTLLHFVYDWFGDNRAVAAFAPANESVWEHLKLVAFPVIVLGAWETRWLLDRRRLWWAKLVEIAVACSFIVAFFYSYTGALGVDSVPAVDIASFVVAVAVGQWTSYRLIVAAGRVAPLWVSVVVVVLVVVGFGVLTFAPPHIPLFRVISTGSYGPA